jgi:hypothetical protein
MPIAAAPTRGYECSVREQLYKADHPRSIDRYIDFFGDGAPRAEADADRSGELVLESLA